MGEAVRLIMEPRAVSRWRFAVALICVVLTALLIRITALDARPMHTDEAVHASILGEMLEGGLYRYNAQDCHGPTLYFLAWPVLKCLGATSLATLEAWQLRIIPAVIGIANILALCLFVREFGRFSVLAGAALMSVAAAHVYYDRYFIHESLFLFFTLLLLASLLRLCRDVDAGFNPGLGSTLYTAAAAGSCIALLFATKETAIITLAAAGAAVLVAIVTAQSFTFATPWSWPWKRILLGAAVAGGCGAVIFVAFYTSFGLHIEGLTDSARAVPRFMNRAVGEGHQKPWWTYLGWLLLPNRFSAPWAGWVLFGFSLSAAWLGWRTNAAVRFMTAFVAVNLLIYSCIPYKTPWLVLTILGPMCLLAGYGFSLVRNRYGNTAVVTALIFSCIVMMQETTRLCFRDPADDRNPYAYSPTVHDIEGISRRLDRAAAARTQNAAQPMVIYVVGADYWPLPWYLRHYPRVGYWPRLPEGREAPDAVVASADAVEQVQARLGDNWVSLPFGLRPGVLVFLFVKKS
ncbi:MAG TPA: flippase activity-associated protein Agl23 [Candidatus Methylacidiphilales bacterium]|nr:flippase activity-associated protein Agl23 [Candidatus Methylacidiphilales bacterium]